MTRLKINPCNFNKACQEHWLSQTDVANRSGVTPNSISKLKNPSNGYVCSLSYARKIIELGFENKVDRDCIFFAVD